MKKISLLFLAITLVLASCKNYDDEFTALNKSIAELQTQVAGFSSLQAGLTALQGSVASLQTTVNAIPTTQVNLAPLQTALATSLANIAALQADLNTVIANYATSTDLGTAQTSINALTAALAAAQLDLNELLAANNVYDDNLTISNAAQLAFAVGLDDKVMIINGFLTIDTDGLSAAAVAAVTSKILNVTGAVTVDNTTDGGVVDLSALTAIGGNVAVTGTADVDFTALTLVTGTYSVTGFDITDDALETVGGAVALDYDGGYNQPNLVSANSVYLNDYQTGVSLSGDAVGTLAVNLIGLTSGSINSGSLTLASATSVILNKGVTTLNANKATVVQIWASNNTALTISAIEDDSVITIAGTVYSTGTTGGVLSVTGSATSVLNAAALTKTSNLTVAGIETALSFPALTVGGVVAANDTDSFSAPLMVATSLSATVATTVNIASAAVTAPALENITFQALAVPYNASATLKTATVTGKVGATGSFTSITGTLISAAFAGELSSVSITGTGVPATDKLTTLTTTGVIGAFTLDNSDTITSISLGHTHIIGGAGSSVTVTNNAKLASLATSTNYLLKLVVTNNALLASMNFASYSSVLSSGAMIVTITGNNLSGDYSDAVAVTGTTPYVQTVITSADLVTLKPFMAAYKAALTAVTTTAGLTMLVTMADVDPTAATLTLVDAMNADTDHLPVFANDTETTPGTPNGDATGLSTVAEFLLIQ